MSGRLRHRRRRVLAEDPEIDRALDAMSAPELRAAVRAVLDELDEGVKGSVTDALIARATKATSGWRPTRPSQRIVEEAKSFADAARLIGHADPGDLTEHLRRATKAFLAGDHSSARAVFEAILPPIARADIDLGQHELVEEVLAVDWTAALQACNAAARLVRESHWRGELLDGAALAAQELGRPDLSRRLEAAWRAAPSLTRLLRWLAVDGHEQEPIRTKATRAVARCPKTAVRQIGLLRVLVGDVTGAATVLSRCPGLGWSNPDHPGHTMFPLLAMLLSNGTIGDALVTELEATARDPLSSLAPTEEEHKPKLATPSMVALIWGARPGIALTEPDQDAAIDAMRIAAQKRVDGILGNSRRQHYGHAALLVASCVAFGPKSRAAELLRWATDLRQQYWRRHAFREELARACESLRVFMPA